MTKDTVTLNGNNHSVTVMSEDEIFDMTKQETGIDPSFLEEPRRIRMEATASMVALGFEDLAKAFASIEALNEEVGSADFYNDFSVEAEKWYTKKVEVEGG